MNALRQKKCINIIEPTYIPELFSNTRRQRRQKNQIFSTNQSTGTCNENYRYNNDGSLSDFFCIEQVRIKKNVINFFFFVNISFKLT